MKYQIIGLTIGAPQDNGDGTVSFIVSYQVGITGEKYGFYKNDSCLVPNLSKGMTAADIESAIQIAANNDCQTKYPSY